MNQCENFRRWMDEAVDGDLRADFSGRLEAHLDECPACRRHKEDLRSLVVNAANLPGEKEPARDLWPGIEDRLSAVPSSHKTMRRVILGVAALVVAAIGLSVWRAPSSGPERLQQADLGVVQAANRAATLDGVRLEYRQAREELLAVVEARRADVSPETLEIIESNLALIDRAIDDIEKVLAANPGEGRLDRHLRLAYARQIELLRWATRIPSQV